MIKEITDYKEIIDFTWRLSQDDNYSSYHKVKTKEELISKLERAIRHKEEKVIACYQAGKLKGVVIYFYEVKDRYLQTIQFAVKEDYQTVVNELIEYIQEGYEGYEFLIPLPASNVKLGESLKSFNFSLLEPEIVTHFTSYENVEPKQSSRIVRITQANFEEYRSAHDVFTDGTDVFYKSDQLLERLERFRLYALYREGKIVGSLFTTYDDILEIFGCYATDNSYEVYQELLLHMIYDLKDEISKASLFVYFINESNNQELKASLDLGFEIRDVNMVYKKIVSM